MKEPIRIPLSDNPKNKEPVRIPLVSDNYDYIYLEDHIRNNENYQQNNTTSIQKLESDTIN